MGERYVVVAEFGHGELLGAMTCSVHLTAENEDDALIKARASKWGELISGAARLTARRSSYEHFPPQSHSPQDDTRKGIGLSSTQEKT